MKMHRRIMIARTIGLALSPLLLTRKTFAQEYPVRPITLVTPFAAGTAVDLVTRIIGKRMSELLGQPLIVENRGGAGGVIGSAYGARQKPDGYTVIFHSSSTLGSSPFLYPDVQYDPISDFKPVGFIGTYVYALVVNPNSEFHTLEELMQYAKSNPGKLSYGSSSSSTLLLTEGFMNANGLDIMQVNYSSSTGALQDVVAGRISMMFTDLTSSIGFIKTNALRPLALATNERVETLPDIPTFREKNVEGLDLSPWTGLAVPAGTSDSIVQLLNSALNETLNQADIRDRLASMGLRAQPSTPEGFANIIKENHDQSKALITKAGLAPKTK